MDFASAITGLGDTLKDINFDEVAVENLVKTLQDAASSLDGKSFETLAKIQPTSFGGNDVAAQLGFHHEKAYQVIGETLKGVVEDITSFAVNAKQVAQLVTETDQNAGDDLQKRETVIADLNYLAEHSEGDRANEEARNHHLGNGNGTYGGGN